MNSLHWAPVSPRRACTFIYMQTSRGTNATAFVLNRAHRLMRALAPAGRNRMVADIHSGISGRSFPGVLSVNCGTLQTVPIVIRKGEVGSKPLRMSQMCVCQYASPRTPGIASGTRHDRLGRDSRGIQHLDGGIHATPEVSHDARTVLTPGGALPCIVHDGQFRGECQTHGMVERHIPATALPLCCRVGRSRPMPYRTATAMPETGATGGLQLPGRMGCIRSHGFVPQPATSGYGVSVPRTDRPR